MMEQYVIPLLIISVGISITAPVSYLFRRHDKPEFDPFGQGV